MIAFLKVLCFLALCLGTAALSAQVEVNGHQKISDTEGEFDGGLNDRDQFSRVATLGDLNGDGVIDLAVGAPNDDDGGSNRGAVWILFLNDDGTVDDHQKISDTEGDFDGALDNLDRFGERIASLGDLDGDDVTDIAVSANYDDDGGANRGAVWILFLNDDGTVKDYQKISDTRGSFGGTLTNSDHFGISVGSLGDLDADGVTDLAVGARYDDDGGRNRGAVWILFLNDDGTVRDYQKISSTEGDFEGELEDEDRFCTVALLGDLDKDGTSDIAVGAAFDDDGGRNRGAVWILFLNDDGTVKGHQKISDTEGDFDGSLDTGDYFGITLDGLGDLDGDGVVDLAVNAQADEDGGPNRGAIWILFLNEDGTVKSQQKFSGTQGGFEGSIADGDHWGDVRAVGDINGDGVMDLSAASSLDDDGGDDRGAVWILFLQLAQPFLRGDVDGNGEVSALSDALYLLRYAFANDDAPPCMDAADVNDDDSVNALADVLHLLLYRFAGGPVPDDPGVDTCGPDPTADDVDCATLAEECE